MSNSLLQGTILQGAQNKYQIEKVLGQGTFGITYLARYKARIEGMMGRGAAWTQVCIKEFFMKDLNLREPDGSLIETSEASLVGKYRKSFIREAKNLSKMHHPGIVNVFEVFEANNTVYIVMEYIDGGNLDDYIKMKGHMKETEALSDFGQICSAIKYMHSQKILHLDLKPKNVMRDQEGHLYLIDFGLSKQYDSNGEPESSTMIGLGTPGYAPIEQAKHQDNDKSFQTTIDIYALGATLYKMLTGKTPPDATDVSNSMLDGDFLIKDNLLKDGISLKTAETVSCVMWPSSKKRIQNVAQLENLLYPEGQNYEKKESGINLENTLIFDNQEEITGEKRDSKSNKNKKEENNNNKNSTSLYRRFVNSQKKRSPFVTVILVLLLIGTFFTGIVFLGETVNDLGSYSSNLELYGKGFLPGFLICLEVFLCIIQTFRFKKSAFYWLTTEVTITMIPFLWNEFEEFLVFSLCSFLGIGVFFLLLQIKEFGKSSWALSEKASRFSTFTTYSCLSLMTIILLLPFIAAWALGFESKPYYYGQRYLNAYLSKSPYYSTRFAEIIATSDDYLGTKEYAEEWYQKSLNLINSEGDEFHKEMYTENWYSSYILYKSLISNSASEDYYKYYFEACKEFGQEKIDKYIQNKVHDGWDESFVTKTIESLQSKYERKMGS